MGPLLALAGEIAGSTAVRGALTRAAIARSVNTLEGTKVSANQFMKSGAPSFSQMGHTPTIDRSPEIGETAESYVSNESARW